MPSTPNRRTRSNLNLNSLPNTVRSTSELCAALIEVNTVVQAFDLPTLDLPARLDISQPRIIETVKAVLPKLNVAVERLHKQSLSVPSLISTLSACIDYLVSPDFQQEIVAQVIASDSFKEAINQQVAEKVRELHEDGEIHTETPKQRVVDLEDKTHWLVSKLVDKTFRKNPYRFTGSIDEWPPYDPGLANMQTTIQTATGPRMVWRPDWSDFASSKPFVDAVLSRFQLEFPNEYKDIDVIERIRRYFVWVSSELAKPADKKSGEKRARGTSSRTTAVAKSLKATFPTSLLNRCQERALYNQALDLGLLKIVQIAHDEDHGLPKADDEAPDGEKYEYDGFQAYRDLWFETRGKEGDAWMVADARWMSEELLRGIWTLYESTGESSRSKTKTPAFHVPSILLPDLSIDALPTLAPPPAAEGSRRKRARSEKSALELTRGMVSQDVLLNDDFDAWRLDLRPDPVPSEDDLARPTLVDMLNRPEHAELKAAVDSHMAQPMALAVGQLRVLWAIRSMGTPGLYLQALRARGMNGSREVGAFLDAFDVTSLYVNADSA